jgi:tetratricopeptide (TPR) repeat protein
MTATKQTTLIASACLAVSMTTSMLLLRHQDQIRPQSSLEDVLYVDSPKVVRRASLGYNGLMACIYWTRAVQYFGHRHYDHARSYNQLAPLLEITTSLDPHLTAAYQFGASFLAPTPPNGAGQPDRAIQLMEYGIQQNPGNWQLYYDMGFVYYTELQDYKKASEVFARGSDIPGAHPSMKILAAQMAMHAGDLETARMLWSATFETSQDKQIRENAAEHLRSIKVDEDVTGLQAAVTRFGERTGRLPSSLYELAATERWPGLPTDPDGVPYKITVEGRILVDHPENFPFISKGLPAGYKPSALPRFREHGSS